MSGMERAVFDQYIDGFNAADLSTFDRFIAADLHMVNETLEITGRQGMKEHYALIWPDFQELLTVERLLSADDRVAIQMWARFVARDDRDESLFGPVLKDETFDFRGLIMYEVVDGQFTDILVAYNSFTHTATDGGRTELGMPH
jgi:predicted ester cyclase